MKKFISILLVAVMMFSFTVTGFAARNTAKLNTTYTVTVKEDEIKYSFYAPEDGVYSFSMKLLSNNSGEYVTAELNTVDSYLGFGYLENFDGDDYEPTLEDGTIFVATKNQEVSITISNFYDDYVEAKMSFIIKKDDSITELKMGQSYTTNGESEYYVLRPTKDAIFDIWSYSTGYTSAKGTDGTYFASDFYFDQLDLPIKAKAGELYLVYVCSSDYESEDDYEAKPITFNVTDGSKIKPEVIEIEEITVAKGDYSYFNVSVLPNGSFYNYDELVFEFKKDGIAEVLEYDKDYEMVSIQGNKIGKTALKVTEPVSGISTTVNVRVVSPLRMYLINLFERIAAFFSFIFS